MRSFEIFLTLPDSSQRASRRETAPDGAMRALLDVFVRGANVTARMSGGLESSALGEVAQAVLGLAHVMEGKRIVRFYEEASELCIERNGARAFLSVYRTGADPEVYVYDREVPFDDVLDGVLEAVERVLAEPPGSGLFLRGAGGMLRIELEELAQPLRTAPRKLHALHESAKSRPRHDERSEVVATIEAPRDLPVAFGAELELRMRRASDRPAGAAESTDWHALLFPGRVTAELRGRTVALGAVRPFLFAETLTTLVHRLLDGWQRGKAKSERIDAGGVVVGARLGADGSLAVIFGTKAGTSTYPALALPDFVESVLTFGLSLVRALVRRDKSQAKNLRLLAFRRTLRELREALREADPSDAKINGAPESYRAYAEHCIKRPSEAPATPSRLRYEPRWKAMVPGIDLGATFLCGRRLVVGSANETHCLDKDSGEVLWHRRTVRGASVVTGEGLARITPDGTFELHAWDSGEVTLRTWLAPRVGGPLTGAVVAGPGLPKLLVVTEGERHLLAVDLLSGEPRWRHAWTSKARSGGAESAALRLRRHGKLLYVTSGDGALTALDAVTGQVVWRVRDRLRFFAAPTLGHDDAFALAGGQAGQARICGLDPYSGETRWKTELEGAHVSTEGSLLLGHDCVMAVRRDARGLAVDAFDRQTGERRWQSGLVAPTGTAWLVVDDRLVGNTPGGELVGLALDSGKTVYRTRFGRLLESDVPRRLEPVLRSGALFVPHEDVHVVRPEDGVVVGSLGCKETIPDLLRIDERCSAYVAEESGHLAAFAASASLSLVKGGATVHRIG